MRRLLQRGWMGAGVLLAAVLLPLAAIAQGLHMTGTGQTFPPGTGSEEFSQLVERWHEFYLLAGTAAVTLVGLLFVAISIHLDVLLHHKRAHLLDLARLTLLAFVYVLIISLMFLAPASSPRVLAATIGSTSLVILGFSVLGLVKEARQKETALDRRKLLRRRLLQIVALVMAVFASYQLWSGEGYGVFLMIAPICIMLGNATGSAWDLMTQVGQLKVQDEAAVK